MSRTNVLKKGFTLIELLVVIAIIGILSSIVLAQLGTARNSAKSTTVQGQLSSARAQAEIFYTQGSTYSGVCSAGTNTIKALLDATVSSAPVTSTLNTTLATAGTFNTVTCHDTATAWAAEGPLDGSVSGTPKMWCVDSTGASKKEAVNLAASATACN